MPGRIAEAIMAYQEVLAIEPNLPDSWYNLAWLLRRSGQPVAALKAYDEALARHITGPEEVWLNKGVIQADDLLNPEAAIQAYETALEFKDDYVPAIFNLANTHEDLGHAEQAIELYQKALDIAPTDAETLARIANMSRPVSTAAPILKQVQDALKRDDIPAISRANLEFSLGKMLDFIGEYDSAFAAYERANKATEADRPQNYPAFDPKKNDAIIDFLMAMPTPEKNRPTPFARAASVYSWAV
jgi:tetratricopeptide (TPR) repeat protein